GIIYASDASLVWEDLKERFDKVNHELWAEYDAMHGEGSDITDTPIAKHSPKPRYKSPNAYCDHCKTKGHMKSDCFQLIGYLPWYKGKKKEGYNVQYNVPAHNSPVPGFNLEYGGHNTGPSYGNLLFSHYYNNAGEISRNVIFREDEYPFRHNQAEISGPSFNDNSDIFVYDDHQNYIVLPKVFDISPSLNISPDPVSSSPTHFSLPSPSAVSSPNTIEPNLRRSTRSSKPPGWL
ncbi:hypothetical protein H5410_028656, partial [Solanum commersonii]